MSANDRRTKSHPIAHPTTSTSRSPYPLARAESASAGSANDGAHPGTTPPGQPRRGRTGRRDLAGLARQLSERDRAILRSVAAHQFLTVRQVHALHFGDHEPVSGRRIARRTLERLGKARLLGTLDRQIGGVRAGSEGLVYFVDVAGDQLLRGVRGRQARRPREPSIRFRDHRLAIADTHVGLVEAARVGRLDLMVYDTEPASWRPYPGLGGARLVLKPDLYAETAPSTASDFVDAWFIEVDLGTESLPTLIRKCHDYEAYRRSGIEQDRSDGAFPRVVWTVTHRDPAKAARRRATFGEAIAADGRLTSALFRVAAPDQLVELITTGGAA